MTTIKRKIFAPFITAALATCCLTADVHADIQKSDVRVLAPASKAPRKLTTDAGKASAAPAPAPVVSAVHGAHGMWIWRTTYHLGAGGAQLVATCRRGSVNEVYLAVDAPTLSDPRLPGLIVALRQGGVRVHALMGDATWYQPTKQQNMLKLIDAVGAYNAHVVNPRAHFVGVHFDIEPHQLPQNKGNRAYMPALVATLRAGRMHAEAFHLEAAADLPRFAITDVPELHRAFVDAVPRLFLMLYELKDKSAGALVQSAADTVNDEFKGVAPGSMVIGVSVDDYADVDGNLRALETAQPGGAHYGGWAIHDEARYARKLGN